MDKRSLPPLPQIHSCKIMEQVFTHRSLFQRPLHIFEDVPSDPSPDNEKFEHLGDAVLELVTTEILMEMYPHLRVGGATKLRSSLVANENLAGLSTAYNLPHRLKVDPAQAVALRASKKIRADLFEAYIGGLYRDQGITVVTEWLKALLTPRAVGAYHDLRAQHLLEPLPASYSTPTMVLPEPQWSAPIGGHLALFNQHYMNKEIPIEWEYEQGRLPANPGWRATATANGVVYGTGLATTKKAARNEAAKKALSMLGILP